MRARFKRPLDDSKDKSAFFLAFFLGLGAILGIRILGDHLYKNELNFIDFLAIAVAITVIFAYGAYIYSTRDRSSISVDRASDNIYYLGLLFTLASLAYSLVKLSFFSTDASTAQTSGVVFEGGRLISLLPDFGLALFSTIAGIFGRIFLQQMRADPLDIETNVREELGRSVQELRATIGEIVGQLNSLSAQTRVSLTELSQNVSATLSETAEKSASAYHSVSDGIGKVSSQLEQQATQIGAHSQDTSAQFAEILTAIKQHLDEISRLPTSMNEAANDVRSNFGEITKHFSDTALQQKELTSALFQTTEKLRSAFSETDWKDFSIEVQKAQQEFASLSAETATLRSKLSDVESRARDGMQKIAEASESIAEAGVTMNVTSQTITKAGELYVETLTESASELRSQTDKEN